MKKIVLAGSYNPDAVVLFHRLLPEGFVLEEATDPESLAALGDKLTDADYLIVRHAIALPDAMLDRAPKLKLIQKWGAGYNQYDVKALGERGLAFANSPGVNAVQVAEMSLLLMLALYRHLFAIANKLGQGIWAKEDYLPKSYTIKGKTVGVVGMGTIGKKVAHLVQAFGARVQYYDAFRQSAEQERALDITYVPFEELFASSDIISLHLPLNKDTHHIVDRKLLSSMKPAAILINAARGGIIKEADLVEAVEKGWIGGVALDVFEDERPEAIAMHPLMGHENAILTPHSGGSTAEVTENMVQCCLDNIVAFDAGALKGPAIVNWEHLPIKP